MVLGKQKLKEEVVTMLLFALKGISQMIKNIDTLMYNSKDYAPLKAKSKFFPLWPPASDNSLGCLYV